MKFVLVHGAKRTPVTVEETDGGGLVVRLNGKELFGLQPVEEFPNLADVQFRLPQLADLNGDPAHDWPVFVRRFQKTQPDLIMAIAHWYKNELKYSAPGIDNLLRVDEDLEALMPILQDLITLDGKLKRGHRSRIASQLGVKDAGNYRDRIDAVISLVLSNSNSLLENFEQKAQFSNVSNVFQKPPKAANE